MGMIPVNRDRRHKAFASIDRAAAMIRGGKTVLVFPEGRRTRTGELQPFKKGGFVMAVRGGVPIIPIGIAGSAHIFPPGFWIRAGGDTVVVIGEPVATSTYDMDSKEELMALVHEKMEALRTEAQARWVARRSP
jgi:1-acyl-sn-glycerol-3-phosphate acyltransferase